jgi:hypothetical protein
MYSPTAVGTFVIVFVANYVFDAVDSHAFGYATNGVKSLVEYTSGHSCCVDVVVHSSLSFRVGKVSADQLSDWSELPSAEYTRAPAAGRSKDTGEALGPCRVLRAVRRGDRVLLSCRRCFARDIDSVNMHATPDAITSLVACTSSGSRAPDLGLRTWRTSRLYQLRPGPRSCAAHLAGAMSVAGIRD